MTLTAARLKSPVPSSGSPERVSRTDLKCGKGAISPGEKCTKGAAQKGNTGAAIGRATYAAGLGTSVAGLGGYLYAASKGKHRLAEKALIASSGGIALGGLGQSIEGRATGNKKLQKKGAANVGIGTALTGLNAASFRHSEGIRKGTRRATARGRTAQRAAQRTNQEFTSRARAAAYGRTTDQKAKYRLATEEYISRKAKTPEQATTWRSRARNAWNKRRPDDPYK